MKSVTEFWSTTLLKGLDAKKALAAAGKTPEEIQQSLGETFKMEGDKLKHFSNAIDVAGQNLEKLHRVLVVSLSEGENAPQKAVKVEEHHYVPDFIKEKKAAEPQDARGGKGGKGGGKPGNKNRGPKPSPWGESPEEKEAKKAAIRAAQAKK